LMVRHITRLGQYSLEVLQRLGNMGSFTAATARAVATPHLRMGAFNRELYKQGVLSLVIICLSGMAVGMVIGLQGYHMLSRFGAKNSLGAMVGLSLVKELGPVITALLVIGRAGSATAAEIGAMVATEQLDGLRMLSIDPIHMVVKPRAMALAFVMPLLTALFITSGIFGGYAAGVWLLNMDPGSYIASLKDALDFHKDVAGCLVKACVFGVILSIISTYRGYNSAPTAEGVSAATTSTVVTASVTVLMFDYIITAIWGV
jgi:phospholipid/cholesterol/gamma-HCH transport system permease protein